MRANLLRRVPVPKSPDSLLAIFSNDRPSEEHLEELGADDILEEVEPIEIEAEASDADATLPPKDAPKVEVKAEANPEPQPQPKPPHSTCPAPPTRRDCAFPPSESRHADDEPDDDDPAGDRHAARPAFL